MKPDQESPSPEKHLLRDIFAEDFEASAYARRDMNLLLREFRLAHWRRKTARITLAAAAVVVVGILTSLYPRERSTQLSSVSASIPSSRPSAATHPDGAKQPATISDEDLLGLFPPGSCFLAELDGKQVLVFKDPSLAAAVFE